MRHWLGQKIMFAAMKLLNIARRFDPSYSVFMLYVRPHGESTMEAGNVVYGNGHDIAHSMTEWAKGSRDIARVVFHAVSMFVMDGGELPEGVIAGAGDIPKGYKLTKVKEDPVKTVN